MGKVQQVTNESDFSSIIRNEGSKLVVVDFFAEWCGPCKFIEPKLNSLAEKYTNVIFIKVDVDRLSGLAQQQGIRAMPTFQFFKNQKKIGEVVGADVGSVEKYITQYGDTFTAFTGSGKTLGSGNLAGQTYVNPYAKERPPRKQEQDDEMKVDIDEEEELRKAIELSKLESQQKKETKEEKTEEKKEETQEGEKKEETKEGETKEEKKKLSDEEILEMVAKQVDQTILSQLLDLQIPKLRAVKAILNSGSKGVEAAMDWLEEHQDDADIDKPLEVEIKQETEEERKARIEREKQKAKELIAQKRRERELAEKKAEIEREKKRRLMGQQTQKQLEQYKILQRQREAELLKKQKREDRLAKQRILQKLKEDKERRRRERLGLQQESPKPAPKQEEAPKTEQPKKEYTECIIQLRLLDGSTQAAKFKPTDTLRTIHSHASMLNGHSNFNLMTPYPRKVHKDFNLTAQDLGLVPRGTLICTTGG